MEQIILMGLCGFFCFPAIFSKAEIKKTHDHAFSQRWRRILKLNFSRPAKKTLRELGG
jgi:hypothetical protein